MGKIKNVLISQPAPTDGDKSPYRLLAEKHKLNLVFKKFIKIEGIPVKEFRQERINFLDYTAVIFTSRNAVDHYFNMAKELRVNIPISMKYFCSSETTAYYLQNYIQYRKRKIFFGKQTSSELVEVILKHKDESFLLPCSDVCSPELPKLLDKNGIKYTQAKIYRTVPDQIASEINIKDFDLLVFFSPIGIKSLKQNYPKFKQNDTLIAAYGHTTWSAVVEADLNLNIQAPTPAAPSMIQALDDFITSYHRQLKNAATKGIDFENPIVNIDILKKNDDIEVDTKAKSEKSTNTPHTKGESASIKSNTKKKSDLKTPLSKGKAHTEVNTERKKQNTAPKAKNTPSSNKIDKATAKAKADKEAASRVLAQKKAKKNNN